MKSRSLTALVVAGALALSACGDDATVNDAADSSPTTAVAADTSGDAMEEDAMADDAMEDAGTIVDVAAGAGQFTTLLAAAEAADLVGALNADGPLTVFAPTDDAFTAALDALGLTAEELLGDTETLTSILTYHVVDGKVLSTDLSDGMTAPTLNGADITVDLSDGVKINNATVTTADVAASNGVIHIIDTVLLPPAGDAMEEDAMADDAMEDAGTIVDVAAGAGQFTTLLAAAEAADLVGALNADGPLTVFAPTDDAFTAALDALGLTAEELLGDTETLTSILTYHVVDGKVLSTDLSDGMTAPTLNGADITVDLSDGVKINNATVTTADVAASNGVIHIIDTVLLPPSG